jgi:hypothetical protein
MIVPVKYLSIELDTKQFNSAIRFIRCQEGAGTNVRIKLDKFKEIYAPNTFYEFVRLKNGEYYVDIKLIKLSCQLDLITLTFGRVIDYNRLRYIPNYKNNKKK